MNLTTAAIIVAVALVASTVAVWCTVRSLRADRSLRSLGFVEIDTADTQPYGDAVLEALHLLRTEPIRRAPNLPRRRPTIPAPPIESIPDAALVDATNAEFTRLTATFWTDGEQT